MNFAEAEDFCKKLTDRAHTSGELPANWEFRLPTEAQWEYACRAGTTTATSFGDKLSSTQANFQGKPYNGADPAPSLKRTTTVGSYPANPWGLHDMHGNVFEWCEDVYGQDYYKKSPAKDPLNVGRANDACVLRGGAWNDQARNCRAAVRSYGIDQT